MLRTLKPASWCLLAAVFLGGCGSESPEWGTYFQIMRSSFKGGFSKRLVSRDEASSIPFSSISYSVNGGDENLLVLATDSGGDLMWTAASHVVILTREGRILRSVGLPHDRGGMVAQGTADLPSPAEAIQGSYRSTRRIDIPDSGLYGAKLDCVTSAKGRQTVTIIGTVIPVTRVDESCRSPNPHWSFTDTYWVDTQSGFVWRSIQHLHPAGTSVQISVLRPPS